MRDNRECLLVSGILNLFFLCVQGCDLNLRNELQRTALHITAIEGHSAIIESLVGHGVDINARDSDGNTGLHVVLINKNARPLSQYTPQMNKVISQFPPSLM